MVKNIFKEVGVQGATAFVYAIAGVVGASAVISFVYGIYHGDVSQVVLSAQPEC